MPQNKTMTTPRTLELPAVMHARHVEANVVRAGDAENSRVFELSFSSETPVRRWFGEEILGHKKGEVRLEWAQSGRAPLLLDHRVDADSQIGVVESVSIKSREGRARVRFSQNPRAAEIMRDVEDGIRVSISVGYKIHAIELVREDDKGAVYRVTDWEVMEISIVTIPADPSIGVGRAQSGAPTISLQVNQANGEPAMPQENVQPVPGARSAEGDPPVATVVTREPTDAEINARADQRVADEMARREGIESLGERFNLPREMRDAAVRDNISIEAFQGRALEHIGQEDWQSRQSASAAIGLTRGEQQRFSFIRTAAYLANPTDRNARDAAAFEIEVSEATQRQYGRSAKGVLVPTDVWDSNSTRAISTDNPTSAGNLVETELRSGDMIEILRNKAVIVAMGARVLRDLTGNLEIPRQTMASEIEIVGEDGKAANDSNLGWDLLKFSPKTFTAKARLTRRMLLQASVDIDALVRADMIAEMGLKLDKSALYDDGAGEKMLGITNITGVGAVPFAAPVPTWEEITDMYGDLGEANADQGSLGWALSSRMAADLMSTRKDAGSGLFIMPESGDRIIGKAMQSNQIAAGDLIYGNWSDIMIALWSGVDLTVDPYTRAEDGSVRLVAHQDADVGLRHPASMTVGRQ